MRILYASQTMAAGIPSSMANWINTHTSHEVRILAPRPFGIFSSFNKTVTQYYKRPADDRKACEWAEVIHCWHTVSPHTLGVSDLLKKKTWIFEWIGCYFSDQQMNRLFPSNQRNYIKFAHLGQGQDNHPCFSAIEHKILPTVIDIHDTDHRPEEYHNKKQSIGFFPVISKRRWPKAKEPKSIVEVINKGQSETLMALSGFPVETHYSDEPFEHIMNKKRSCVLGIDCVIRPYYNLTTFEFLCCATPCIVWLDDYAIRQLKETTGSNTIPWINSDLSKLQATVACFFTQTEDEKKQRCVEARQWVETYYDPHDIIQHHLKYYKEG